MKLLTTTRNCKKDDNSLIKTASLIARSKESELDDLIDAITTTDPEDSLSKEEKEIAEKVLARAFLMLNNSKNSASVNKCNTIIDFFDKQTSEKTFYFADDLLGRSLSFANMPLERQLPTLLGYLEGAHDDEQLKNYFIQKGGEIISNNIIKNIKSTIHSNRDTAKAVYQKCQEIENSVLKEVINERLEKFKSQLLPHSLQSATEIIDYE